MFPFQCTHKLFLKPFLSAQRVRENLNAGPQNSPHSFLCVSGSIRGGRNNPLSNVRSSFPLSFLTQLCPFQPSLFYHLSILFAATLSSIFLPPFFFCHSPKVHPSLHLFTPFLCPPYQHILSLSSLVCNRLTNLL